MTSIGYLDQLPGIPITVGIWDRLWGEDCRRDPIAQIQVTMSTAEPIQS